jgi:hypothetical protein
MANGAIPEHGRVELKVYFPQQPLRLISARRSSQIRSLHCLWPSSPKRYIFNGFELLEEKTFESYDIRNGDLIIAFPRESPGIFQWIALTRDHELFNESLKWVLDPETADEAARLRDLQLWKLEHRPRNFVRLYAPFEEKPHATQVTVIGKPPTEPCCERMPVKWDKP